MYSLKFAHLVLEKLPDAKCYEFFIDMRAFGKGYEEFYERIREEGVLLVRGRSGSVRQLDSQLYVRGEDVDTNRMLEVPVDMVVLSVGLQPSHGSADLGEKLGIPMDTDGWFRELNRNADPNSTGREGIYLAGVCQGPKDIPDTVAQASAAAAYELRSIVRARGREDLPEPPVEEKAGSPVLSRAGEKGK
jgi:heterodisulfide reductase subunit A